MNKQRGILTGELAIKLSILIFLLITLIPPVAQLGYSYASAKSVEAYVNKIIQLSNVNYSEDVLRSRCLSQTELSMSHLNLDSSLNSIDFTVEYVQHSTMTNVKPVAIKITAHFNDSSMLSSVSRFLESNEYSANSMIFYAPLSFRLPDWQQLDVATGCIK
ncbi:hypothetical protein ACQ5UA_17705 [Vibrio cholerae]|uniref:hypothetical protein n=1 Tax=Vibrio cholerae TaxID=666 RepID=UPI0036F88B9D